MEKGDIITLIIDSCSKWNTEKRIHVEKNGYYLISVNKEQIWFDKNIACGADGCDGNIFNKTGAFLKLKRSNSAKWMCLVGSLNKTKPYFTIGLSLNYQPKDTGDLYLFANDAWWFYGNNKGKIEVRVERIE